MEIVAGELLPFGRELAELFDTQHPFGRCARPANIGVKAMANPLATGLQ